VHEPLLIASERLVIPYIFNSRLSSSLVDKVDIFASELVLHGFIVNLDTEGAHSDFRGRMASTSYTKKKGVSLMARLGDVQLPHSAHGTSSIDILPCFFKPSYV
jgi:hypothetical protein